MTLKEALESGYCSLDDEFDFDDTPQGEEIDFKYTLDNSKYAFESHTKGPYTLNAKF